MGSVSRWWLDLWSIDVCDGISWDWFSTIMCVRVLGNGRNTSFWKDSWCTTTPFCVRYGRLFSITINSEATVADMFFGRGGGVEWNWRWRRPLFQWELEQLDLLVSDLRGFQVQEYTHDSWRWKADSDGKYSVKSAYHVIVNDSLFAEIPLHRFIWCRLVPYKVSCFVWRVLLDRFPSKFNLVKRHVLINSDSSCVWCQYRMETSSHLFFECYFAYHVWMLSLEWCGFTSVLLNSFIAHFDQFLGLPLCPSKMRYRWAVIWLTVIWSIWLARNALIFSDKVLSTLDVLELVKLRTWKWLKARDNSFSYSFSSWAESPAVCLNFY
uniref:Reverse transcriptase zinc-binding domain-containing protein n=1 Tax=Cajanus cajan TaxID=3821 RepID=A0A151SE09_CAJCA|nr:hypothetical protein KK1_025062 [Cajanus cajan]